MSSLAQAITSAAGPGRRGRFGHGQRLVTGEVGRLLEDELVLVLVLVEDVVQALVAVDGRAGAGLAPANGRWWPRSEAAMIASASASPPLTLSAPTWARIPGTPTTRRSIVTTRNLGVHGFLHRGASALASSGLVTWRPRPGDAGLDVGGLLGGAVLAVRLDQRDVTECLGLDLQLLLHVDEEREGETRSDVMIVNGFPAAKARVPTSAISPAPASSVLRYISWFLFSMLILATQVLAE